MESQAHSGKKKYEIIAIFYKNVRALVFLHVVNLIIVYYEILSTLRENTLILTIAFAIRWEHFVTFNSSSFSRASEDKSVSNSATNPDSKSTNSNCSYGA